MIPDENLERQNGKDITKFSGEDKSRVKKVLVEGVLESRIEKREIVIKAYNQLREHIYELTHHTPTEEDIAIAFSHLKSPTIPKDYQKKVLAAFDPKKLKEVPFYTQVDEQSKDLNGKIYGESKLMTM